MNNHEIFNKKRFIAPESLMSMAVIHTKIKPCGEVQIRISDCNNTIKIWNNLNDPDQVEEMLTKIVNLKEALSELEINVKKKLPVMT
ncbi:hypothetical protein [Flavobacterium sp. 25HG05S-40]|uniref:hypothetical protein n=1 Tax=Flavobacterium sp. 25HG05S-40 TaxID=3458682 RepID=UPI0040440438